MNRTGTAADLTAVCDIFERAFAPSGFEADLYALAVEGTEDCRQWVAERDGRVVACVLYTPALREKEAIGYHLAPVAVHPDFQRQGIGTELISLSLADEVLRDEAVFVVGEARFYRRFGFLPVRSVRSRYDEGHEHFRALRWTESDEPFEVGYIPAFTQAVPAE